MAIIVPSSGGLSGLEAAAVEVVRPALLVRDGTFQIEPDAVWTDQLEQNRAHVERAIRAVGRLEMDDAIIPWAGTAFLIEPARAVTASFVAQTMVWGRRGSDSKAHGRLQGMWLNLKA